MNKMFDDDDLPVLTFYNWALKAEWLSVPWNYTYVFLRFFPNPITWFFTFLSRCTRFVEHWSI